MLGFVLHTPLLVPYFSWKWSHHVHHSKVNHIDDGETHVPLKVESWEKSPIKFVSKLVGKEIFAVINMATVLTVGWPLYLITGVTGGPSRGWTSHFIAPNKLFKVKMMA